MKKKRILLWLLALFVSAAVLAYLIDPSHVVRWFLFGEAFFKGRPTSYWREILRADGQARKLSEQTIETFGTDSLAAPVLLECLSDPDPNVRGLAAALLGRCGFPRDVLPGLRAALKDPDAEVRLNVLGAFYSIGRNAMPAANDVAELLKDPEVQVAHVADLAIWRLHVPTALQAEGWRRFQSSEWDFSAEFPAEPEKNNTPVEGPNGKGMNYSFQASHGVTRCFVSVTEYPPKVLQAAPEEERTRFAGEMAAFGLGGKFVRDEPIEQDGRKGREHEIERDDGFIFMGRHYWVGQRLYLVGLAYKPKFLNPTAAKYFLDSFRWEGPLAAPEQLSIPPAPEQLPPP